MNTIATKIRAEAQDSQKRRHEFALRKLAYTTALLGAGSLAISVAQNPLAPFATLLYLVPLVAFAFDYYIFIEDYRVKRVGKFLLTHPTAATDAEKDWEDFVCQHPNPFAPFAFFVVTMILLTGAALMLWKTGPNLMLFFTWIAVVVIAEAALIWKSIHLRPSSFAKNFAKNCVFCGQHLDSKSKRYIYQKDRQMLVVENVPCLECTFCGKRYFDAGVLQKIENYYLAITQQQRQPQCVMQVAVEDFTTLSS